MLKKIKIHEVGFRDGLQNESKIVDTERKINWIAQILNSGIDIVQIGSFVHPVKMPQMADTDTLFDYFSKIPHKALLSGLVLNEKGFERGMKCGVEMFCMGVSASETHSQKNTGMSIQKATDVIISIAREAVNAGKVVQVSVQSAFGCGFEGKIPEENVLMIVGNYLDAGLKNISLADTAGYAYPEQVKRLFSSIKRIDESSVLTAHFHNTYGLGLANCYAAMSEGAEYFETAFAGLGGCPFTKVAAGNVSTEDFVHSLNRNDVRRDIDLEKILNVADSAQVYFEKENQSYLSKVGRLGY
ncbi:MAG: hydroxymethylglutaryl-CoA lyase [Candidatus Kapabacteria bacterium]|nr:hydroxymethylglutaryl-CoA lyase [Ignavibacteriota bacterium]MCW5885503.1 hydroxymethylglutaryl-CoA lyase [Candidatus Kapabacteria bacterium]